MTTKMIPTTMSYLLLLILGATFRTGFAACLSSDLNLIASSTDRQTVSSPNFPSSYPHQQNCGWTINSGSDSSKVIAYLGQSNFEREYDFLLITDSSGVLFSSATNRAPAVIISSGQTMVITMTTDYSVAYTGFYLDYMAVASPISCGTSVTASSERQSFYASYMSGCIVTITASNSADYIEISAPISHIDVAVQYSGSTASTFVGTTSVVIPANNLNVTTIDKAVVVFASRAADLTTTAVLPTTTYSAGSVCTNRSLTTEDQTEQFFTSQNYPSAFDTSSTCDIVITTVPSMAIQLRVDDIELGPLASLTVYDGTTDFNFLGFLRNTNETIVSTSNAVHLYFRSGSYGTARGFRIGFSTVSPSTPSCSDGITLNEVDIIGVRTDPAYFYSRNYPNNYPNNHYDYWVFRKDLETETIVLEFDLLQVELSTLCRRDQIAVYDGPCTDNRTIRSLCGYNRTHVVRDSSGMYVRVVFTTDGSVTGGGFRFAVYKDLSSTSTLDSKTSNIIGGVVGGVFAAIVVCVIVFFFYNVCKKEEPAKADVQPTKMKFAELLRDMKTKAAVQKLREKVPRKNKPSAPPASGQPVDIPKSKPRPPPPFPPSHPPPNPPGHNVNVLTLKKHGFMNTSHHPAPNPVGFFQDKNPVGLHPTLNPVGPHPTPNYLGPNPALTPVIPFPSVPPGSDDPMYPPAPIVNITTLPPPFKYITPAEALSHAVVK